VRRRFIARATTVVAVGVFLVALGIGSGYPGGESAGASTTAGTLVGEGGAYLQPVIDKLLQADGSGFLPDYGSYVNVDIDRAISDFVGSGPGQFDADWVVSERPLTATEASTAQSNGRTFAYLPFAADPVAIVTLVPNASFNVSTEPISASTWCTHIPLSLTQLAEIYGLDTAQPLLNWSDSRLSCTGGTPLYSISINLGANLDPTMENYAPMALLDSTPASKALFDAGLENAFAIHEAVTASDTPSEDWPYSQNTIPGGDQPFIGKMIGINPLTNAPNTSGDYWHLGVTFPISSVWTGAPLGTPWDLPTAAIENAAGQDVAPSTESAAASEVDATLASTTDPETNNLVTFNPDASDTAAYNSYLMEESYLVVPLNGLPADKAIALAQFIRFILGPVGQADISNLGAAPATSAMVTAGLQVAQEVNNEASASLPAATGSAATSTTTTIPKHSGGTVTTSTTAPTTTTTSASPAGSAGSSGTSGGSSSGLAFTGSDPLPLVVLGTALVIVGEICRRSFRRRRART
jgi:ABC-type phosphate transport system substrate-binding protein